MAKWFYVLTSAQNVSLTPNAFASKVVFLRVKISKWSGIRGIGYLFRYQHPLFTFGDIEPINILNSCDFGWELKKGCTFPVIVRAWCWVCIFSTYLVMLSGEQELKTRLECCIAYHLFSFTWPLCFYTHWIHCSRVYYIKAMTSSESLLSTSIKHFVQCTYKVLFTQATFSKPLLRLSFFTDF